MDCILCDNSTELFKVLEGKKYFKCSSCQGVMLDPKHYLSPEGEKARYEEHNNDVEDKGYQRFVLPIVTKVLEEYGRNHKGLDFGAGTGPVITKLLEDQGYDIKLYDPFFANKPEQLEATYDYIVCCEVMEHFYDPCKEFKLLKSLLNPGGTLYLKTKLYNKEIEFETWHYKNDPTHVFFYEQDTLKWIQKHYKFSNLKIKKDLILLGGKK